MRMRLLSPGANGAIDPLQSPRHAGHLPESRRVKPGGRFPAGDGRAVRPRASATSRGPIEEALIRNLQAVVELFDHPKAQRALAVEHLGDPATRADVGLQITRWEICSRPAPTDATVIADPGVAWRTAHAQAVRGLRIQLPGSTRPTTGLIRIKAPPTIDGTVPSTWEDRMIEAEVADATAVTRGCSASTCRAHASRAAQQQAGSSTQRRPRRRASASSWRLMPVRRGSTSFERAN